MSGGTRQRIIGENGSGALMLWKFKFKCAFVCLQRGVKAYKYDCIYFGAVKPPIFNEISTLWTLQTIVLVFVLSTLNLIKVGDYSCKIRWTVSAFYSLCSAQLHTTPPVLLHAWSCPITQMRAVETLQNEDGVIFLLDLKERCVHVFLLWFRRTT